MPTHHLLEDPGYSAADLCVVEDRLELTLLLHGVPLFDLIACNFGMHSRRDRLHLLCVNAKSDVRGK